MAQENKKGKKKEEETAQLSDSAMIHLKSSFQQPLMASLNDPPPKWLLTSLSSPQPYSWRVTASSDTLVKH